MSSLAALLSCHSQRVCTAILLLKYTIRRRGATRGPRAPSPRGRRAFVARGLPWRMQTVGCELNSALQLFLTWQNKSSSRELLLGKSQPCFLRREVCSFSGCWWFAADRSASWHVLYVCPRPLLFCPIPCPSVRAALYRLGVFYLSAVCPVPLSVLSPLSSVYLRNKDKTVVLWQDVMGTSSLHVLPSELVCCFRIHVNCSISGSSVCISSVVAVCSVPLLHHSWAALRAAASLRARARALPA